MIFVVAALHATDAVTATTTPLIPNASSARTLLRRMSLLCLIPGSCRGQELTFPHTRPTGCASPRSCNSLSYSVFQKARGVALLAYDGFPIQSLIGIDHPVQRIPRLHDQDSLLHQAQPSLRLA